MYTSPYVFIIVRKLLEIMISTLGIFVNDYN